ncbi:MAG: hypothetical protein ACI9U2_003260 [Bradymonadia bacterium]|jgi:hypothetical protein
MSVDRSEARRFQLRRVAALKRRTFMRRVVTLFASRLRDPLGLARPTGRGQFSLYPAGYGAFDAAKVVRLPRLL